MTEWLQALEASAPAAALRASFWIYPLVNALHIAGLGALVTSVLVMDVQLLRRAADGAAAERLLRPVAIAGLVVALLTGFALFSVRPVDYAANPAFRLKLVLLALALANAAIFLTTSRGAVAGSPVRRPLALLCLGLSLLLWPAVLVAGRFIGFVE
ncbi:hypothetical protein [Methylobrevis pamukkalensis]|uniref:DUF2214 domain-containing protein n=1 Tax=Methylobrevis pamukkalensis TaxID=1439726 RepID=A0A1E3H6R3_9HYPH|nr:hypothetical protein [Methylobrevis pamukkalensis]ODN71476.1 hypothetical protein A6302_01165 [Methylobrevis pamukkalensis]